MGPHTFTQVRSPIGQQKCDLKLRLGDTDFMRVPKGTIVEVRGMSNVFFSRSLWREISSPLKVGEKVAVPEYPEWTCDIEYRGSVDDLFVVKCEHGEYVVVPSIMRISNRKYEAKEDTVVPVSILGDNLLVVEAPLRVGQYRNDSIGVSEVMALYSDRVVLRSTHSQFHYVAMADEVVKFALTSAP
jgi:hypothetical protein